MSARKCLKSVISVTPDISGHGCCPPRYWGKCRVEMRGKYIRGEIYQDWIYQGGYIWGWEYMRVEIYQGRNISGLKYMRVGTYQGGNIWGWEYIRVGPDEESTFGNNWCLHPHCTVHCVRSQFEKGVIECNNLIYDPLWGVYILRTLLRRRLPPLTHLPRLLSLLCLCFPTSVLLTVSVYLQTFYLTNFCFVFFFSMHFTVQFCLQVGILFPLFQTLVFVLLFP